MPLIPPEVAAFARVKIVPNLLAGTIAASYEFANGFDSSVVAGATYGAPVIGTVAPNEVVLFLTQPLAPGNPTTVSPTTYASEGGLKARVDIVQVATKLSTPTPQPRLEARWYYGNYALATVTPAGAYANVDPLKAITVDIFTNRAAALQEECTFDIVVFRNVQATYKPPVIYGTFVPVKVFP
jgi:hypothetical protein